MLLVVAMVMMTQLGTPSLGQEECIYKADVAFVIDLSQENQNLWTKTRIFIKDVFDGLQIASNRTRVGTLSSSPVPSVRFYLNQSTGGNAKYKVDMIGRPQGSGDIGETLQLLQNDFFMQPKGDREHTPNIVVILSDGVGFNRTYYNIYSHDGKLLLQRPRDSLISTRGSTIGVTVPTNPSSTKPTVPSNMATNSTTDSGQTSTESSSNSSTTSTKSSTSSTTILTLSTKSTPTSTPTSTQDLNSTMTTLSPMKNLTLHEKQTRFVIHVTEDPLFDMERLASTPYHVLSVKDVRELVTGIQQASQVECHAENDGGTTAPPPMTCDNLACYGNEACKRSHDGDNQSRDTDNQSYDQSHDQDKVVTCSCEGEVQSKYCPKEPEQYGEHNNRTCRINEAKRIDPNFTTCPAHISTLCPTYGPDKGGTDIFIWGDNFAAQAPPVVTFMPYFTCNVAFYNSTLIQCKTMHAAQYDIQHSLLRLRIEFSDGCQTNLASAFHYRPNPEIKDVRPLKITHGGGQVLTVFGENLDSDTTPRLQITATNGIQTAMFASLCDVQSNKALKCKSPPMDLSNFTNSLPNNNQRQRRSTDPAEEIQYSLGMSFIGYENFTESLPNLGQLEVVNDPLIEKFQDEEEIMVFRPAWPHKQKVITIKGDYLLEAFVPTDYTVTIGKSYCIIIDVTSTKIQCVPPSKRPQTLNSDAEHPEVMVYHGATSSPVGRLRYDTSPWSHGGFRAGVAVVIVMCVALLVAALIYLLYSLKKKKSAVKKPLISDERKNIYLVGDYLDPNVDLQLALSAELENKISALILAKEVIQEEETVQTGNQGIVCNGWMLDKQENQTKKLTIKAFKDKGAPFMHIERFLESAVNLKDCDHKNVMQILGLLTYRNLPRAVYNHMEYGDLKQHLCDLKEKVLRIDFKEMLHYCEDAAAGLAYIHDKGIVHEDIAARNCWVDKQHVVKICDASLSPDLFEDDYYLPGEKLRPLPVRWMAPESMVHKVYTYKSDVWSFGVLLWEIMSLGEMPYLAFSDHKIQDHVEEGNHLAKPDLSTAAMYALMTRCWTKDHKKRPTMKEISQEMESFIQGEFMNPTLARPPKGKKGGLSVLTSPMVKADMEYKGKFKKNSMVHDNKAFVHDEEDEEELADPELSNTGLKYAGLKGVGLNRGLQSDWQEAVNERNGNQEDYEAEYEYLKPDLIRMGITSSNNRDSSVASNSDDVAIDVDTKTYENSAAIESNAAGANYYANHSAIQGSHPGTASSIDMDTQDNQDETYHLPLSKGENLNNAEYYNDSVKSKNSEVRPSVPSTFDHIDGGHNLDSSVHGNGSIQGNNSIRSNSNHGNSSIRTNSSGGGSSGKAGVGNLLTGIRASFLEADGYKIESNLSDASVLY